MQRSVVRAHPALLERVHLEVDKENGHRSQSRNHARLHRMQAAELSDGEVEAELARPGGVQEVLPVVWSSHPAPGDSLTGDPSMARQTRQQRRARRAQQEPALAGGPPPRGPAKPTANGGSEPNRGDRGSGGRPRPADEHEKHGFGPWVFVQESVGELKKVEWPSRQAVTSATAGAQNARATV